MSMYPDREVFASSPLVLVAAEIRFTDAARMRQQETRDAITIALEDYFPIAEQLSGHEFSLSTAGPPQFKERAGVVLRDVHSTQSLTLLSNSMIYETTQYSTFDDLLRVIGAACEVLVNAKVRPALERVGLRYIDEVRVDRDIKDSREWSTWIDPRLIEHLAVGPEQSPATSSETVSNFDLGGGRGLTARTSALPGGGSVVNPQYLRRPAMSSGSVFVLDFDGYQDFALAGESVLLSTDAVREALSAVHAPCGAAFQRSITETARNLFRMS